MFILDPCRFVLWRGILFIKDGWPCVAPLDHQLLGQVLRFGKASWRGVVGHATRPQDGCRAEVLISDIVDISNRYWGEARDGRRRWEGSRRRGIRAGLSRARGRARRWWDRRRRLWNNKVVSCAVDGMSCSGD